MHVFCRHVNIGPEFQADLPTVCGKQYVISVVYCEIGTGKLTDIVTLRPMWINSLHLIPVSLETYLGLKTDFPNLGLAFESTGLVLCLGFLNNHIMTSLLWLSVRRKLPSLYIWITIVCFKFRPTPRLWVFSSTSIMIYLVNLIGLCSSTKLTALPLGLVLVLMSSGYRYTRFH